MEAVRWARRSRARPAAPAATASARVGERDRRVPVGPVSANAQIGWSPLGAAIDDPDPRAAPVDVALVIQRHRDLGPATPRQRRDVGRAQRRHRLEQRAARRRACARWLAANRPARTSPCRRAGSPRPSTWRSTLGADALIHACTAPPPTTTVFARQRRGHVRQRRPGRVLLPLVLGRGGPQPTGRRRCRR